MSPNVYRVYMGCIIKSAFVNFSDFNTFGGFKNCLYLCTVKVTVGMTKVVLHSAFISHNI